MKALAKFMVFPVILFVLTTAGNSQTNTQDSNQCKTPHEWTLGTATLYTHNLHTSNLGINVLITRCINDNWRFHWSNTINGLFAKKNFNRVGMSTLGIEYDFGQYAYAFTGIGIVVDPSTKRIFGMFSMSESAGIGARFHFSKNSTIYTEMCTDFAPSIKTNSISYIIGLAVNLRESQLNHNPPLE